MLFNLFASSSKKVGGIIGFLNLQDFYESLSPQEQSRLKKYHDSCLGSSNAKSDFIEGKIITSTTRLKFLNGMIGWAESDKQYTLADKLIQEGNKYISENLIDTHFFFQISAECYYKQRDIRPDAYDKCIEYCLKDIELFPQYCKPLVKELGAMPKITTFQRLAIAYEKKERYQDAIDVCNKALEYNLSDGTKGGYEGRKSKLEKKLNK